ncbi:hypothetical protein HYS50_04085, partial [Candidatus Woesearchaeota archaeon]|nr:hypothetical protein [Candidatus Woesearchaeota archaeon]
MVSKYDVFYIIATKGETKVAEIVKTLRKPEQTYKSVFNQVVQLEKEGYVQREKTIKVIHSERSKQLFRLISFCMNNSINYNLMFKKNMITFIKKAAKREFFTREDVKVHPQTFSLYVAALAKYGLLFIVSRKPLQCKLLRHHFLMDVM